MSRYTKRFLIALCASVSIHALVMEVWGVMVMMNLITGRAPKIPELPKPPVPVLTIIEPPRNQRPMTFVETDPSQESKQKPQDASLYSDRSTLAASPTAEPTK